MKPEYIIIHHSLTEDSQTVSWNAIYDYHVHTLGWKDIGYHFGIEKIYGKFQILVGRMLDEVGAHCKQEGMNTKSIGICCVGNFDNHNVPAGQMDKLVDLVSSLMRVFNIPLENVKMHREYATYKSCPGTMFQWDGFKAALTVQI